MSRLRGEGTAPARPKAFYSDAPNLPISFPISLTMLHFVGADPHFDATISHEVCAVASFVNARLPQIGGFVLTEPSR